MRIGTLDVVVEHEPEPGKPQRSHELFEIGPHSSPRKVARWLARGGGKPLIRPLDVITRAHVYPRSRRRA